LVIHHEDNGVVLDPLHGADANAQALGDLQAQV
jgi:hypothetical protein